MGLPYDYSLNHHQLVFILTFICSTKMEIFFTKSKRKLKIYKRHCERSVAISMYAIHLCKVQRIPRSFLARNDNLLIISVTGSSL